MIPMNIDFPPHINFGKSIVDNIHIPNKKVLCLLTPSLDRHNDIGRRLQTALAEQQAECLMVRPESGEPNSDALDRIVAQLPRNLDVVIGIGGGSTMDSAKFIAMLKVSGGRCADYEFGGPDITGALPIYLAPTTSGSGSEATSYAVATNSKTGRKFTLNHDLLFPRSVFIDPTLTIGLPPRFTVATALDAFIHCFEARLNRQDHQSIHPYAIQGMRLIRSALDTALRFPDNLEARSQLSAASVLGGVCIATSRTGLIHTLSVAFSEFIDEPHGILNARMLPFALNFNRAHYGGLLTRVVSKVWDKKIGSDEEAVAVVNRWVVDMLDRIGNAPADWSWLHDKSDHLVDRIMQDKGLPAVNPREINANSIPSVVESVINSAS